MSNAIVQYTEESMPIIERSNAIVIDSPEAMVEATALLSQINKNLDRIKAEKEKVLAPLREAANAEKARWEPLEKLFKPVVERLRTAMSAYQTAALKKKAEDDAKIAARVGDGKGKLRTETAIRKMTENAVDEKIETDLGGLSFRDKKQLKVTDSALVPKEFWIINEKALFDALLTGVQIPGAEIEVIQVPINKR